MWKYKYQKNKLAAALFQIFKQVLFPYSSDISFFVVYTGNMILFYANNNLCPVSMTPTVWPRGCVGWRPDSRGAATSDPQGSAGGRLPEGRVLPISDSDTGTARGTPRPRERMAFPRTPPLPAAVPSTVPDELNRNPDIGMFQNFPRWF